MLWILLIQKWYDLCDPAMEDALIEVPSMRRLAGIDLISERISDEATILVVRHLLERHDHRCHLDRRSSTSSTRAKRE